MAICIFSNEKSTIPKWQNNITWHDVLTLHRERQIRSKKSGQMLGGYALNGKRSNANVTYRSFIPLDVDTEGEKNKSTDRISNVTKQAPPLEQIRLAINHCEWCAASSHWHEPRRGVIKYRITMLPDRNIQHDEYEPILGALDELLDGALDRNAWQWSQAFYLPSCPPENEADAFFVHNNGSPLPVDEFVYRGRQIIEARKRPQKQEVFGKKSAPLPETPDNIALVKSMLAAIPANLGRNEWLKTVWAIASTSWSCAEAIAREWSATAPEKYAEDDFDGVWKSYDPEREKGVGFGTLVYVAKEHGWSDAAEGENLTFNGLGADIFNRKKFAAMFRNKLLFVDETNEWLLFARDQGWLKALPGEAERAAKEVVDVLKNEYVIALRREL